MDVLKQGRLICAVNRIEIFRLKQGEDHVYLHTNMPNPRGTFNGGLAFHCMVARFMGDAWVASLFPNVETVIYDHTTGRSAESHNPAAALGEGLLSSGISSHTRESASEIAEVA